MAERNIRTKCSKFGIFKKRDENRYVWLLCLEVKYSVCGGQKALSPKKMFAPAAPVNVQVSRRLFSLFLFFLYLNATYILKTPNAKVHIRGTTWRLLKFMTKVSCLLSALRLCSKYPTTFNEHSHTDIKKMHRYRNLYIQRTSQI